MKGYPFKYISLNPTSISFPDDFPIAAGSSPIAGARENLCPTIEEKFNSAFTGIEEHRHSVIEMEVQRALHDTKLELGDRFFESDTPCHDVAYHGGLDSRILGDDLEKMGYSLAGYICMALDRLVDAYVDTDLQSLWMLHTDISLSESFLFCGAELIYQDEAQKDARSLKARKAAILRHSKPGGSHEKQRKIREIWATGKYTTKDRCAEEECRSLGMSYKAARNALIGEAEPK